MHDVALAYQQADLCVLPASLEDKRPAVSSWKQYQQRLPTDDEMQRWFTHDSPLCIVTGEASGNLEMIDFDCAGEKFAWWKELVQAKAPGLMDRLVLERSPSGGWHAVYRCQSPVCGNIKLAERAVTVPNGDEIEFYGKKYRPRQVGDHWEVWLTLIETRGEGGIFLCAPTPGYELTQGRFEELPLLTDQERELLLETAWALNEREPSLDSTPQSSEPASGRPGDEFNERGDVREVLRKHGWTLVRAGENEYWRRPGKTAGWSATLKDNVLYVFSSNAAPFEPNRGHSPFAVYTLLEHGGDHTRAAATLRQQGYGDSHDNVDLSQLNNAQSDRPPPFEFKFITSNELANTKYDLEYLIDGILVRGQPMIVAAPRKGLKTNTSVDMALALAEGGLYLGRFNVPRPVRVAMMSAESGEATIQETANRIAIAKSRRLQDFDNPLWAFQVPMLNCQAHLDALRRAIEQHEIEVLILDPTYLMMVGIGDGAANLFLVGSFLKPLSELAQEYGVTIIMCHHLKKSIVDPHEPAELDNIAWAGFQEFVRQWILLNRRSKYDPANGGHHELWMSVGGSAGHSGLWGLNIDEGTLQDVGGRRWDVDVISGEEAYEERNAAAEEAEEERRERQQNSKHQKQRAAIMDALNYYPEGETTRTLREHAGIGNSTALKQLNELVDEGIVERCRVAKHTRTEDGFRLVLGDGPETGGGPVPARTTMF